MSVASAIPTGTWTLALRQRFRLPATTMPVQLNRHLPSAVMQFPGPSFTKVTAHGACLPSGYGPVFESVTRWPCFAIIWVRDPVAEASVQMGWRKRVARHLPPNVVAALQRFRYCLAPFRRRLAGIPQPGAVDMGDFSRLTPISRFSG